MIENARRSPLQRGEITGEGVHVVECAGLGLHPSQRGSIVEPAGKRAIDSANRESIQVSCPPGLADDETQQFDNCVRGHQVFAR